MATSQYLGSTKDPDLWTGMQYMKARKQTSPFSKHKGSRHPSMHIILLIITIAQRGYT